MRHLLLVPAIAFAFIGCSRQEATNDKDSAAREAGRAAYKLHVDADKAAKQLSHDIKNAGREAQQGWNEAKHEHQADRAADPPRDREADRHR